ncbi:MAG: membrane-bound lytic murein transglycosylase MltF [Gammaproteobacteria bacterium]|nr:membrane-bound lytic murein transglycosylase MltF [Gammaproteobacteria bacterium]
MKPIVNLYVKSSTALISIGVSVVVFIFLFYTETGLGLFKETHLDKIRAKGQLDILIRNAPTIMYEGRNGKVGLEYDLISDFAEHLDVTPNFIVKSDTVGILQGFINGEADIATAGLTQTTVREKIFYFGPQYQSVEQQVVCRRDSIVPATPSDLKNTRLWVTAASSYVGTLKQLKEADPELSWNETDAYDSEQLLQHVWEKKIDCTVADSNIVSINRRYYPELVVAFNITDPEPHAWLLPMGASDLQKVLNQWFEFYKSSGELQATLERNFGYVDSFDYVDTQHFKKQIVKRLPIYKKHFQNAAKKEGLPWTLIAAQSYQESHWRARAKSPTGVRGIMMLTLPTAREVGVKRRLDPKTSIFGGTKYLKKLIRSLPLEIQEPDRTWFALAAYNVGMGHMKDARKLAVELNKDPNIWNEMAEVLPLLAQKKYYKELKYGYARGREPVLYVKRIRNFQDILEREMIEESLRTAALKNESES